jgi:hypothetical protein
MSDIRQEMKYGCSVFTIWKYGGDTYLKISIDIKAATDKAVNASENMKDWDENFRTNNGVRLLHHSLNVYGNPHALKNILHLLLFNSVGG